MIVIIIMFLSGHPAHLLRERARARERNTEREYRSMVLSEVMKASMLLPEIVATKDVIISALTYTHVDCM